MEAVRARLRLLYHFSDLMYSSWRLLNLSPNNQVSKDACRPMRAWLSGCGRGLPCLFLKSPSRHFLFAC